MSAEPITLTCSWSEVQSWRKCPMKHYLSYRQRQPQVPAGKARQIGTAWHGIMQDWYTHRMVKGKVTAEHRNEMYSAHLGWRAETEEEEAILGTLIWMWQGFLEHGDPFTDWQVAGIEQEIYAELPRIAGQPDHVTIQLKAIVDLILKKNNRWQVVDHKSQAKKLSPDTLTRDMDMDDQLTMYLAAIHLVEGAKAHHMAACWNYAITTDLKKTPRPPEDRYWQSFSARTHQELTIGMQEFSESVLDAYARPLDIEPPRSPDKENCRWMCDHRSRCFYARAGGFEVELDPPVKPDQAPLGIPRVYVRRT